MDVIEAITTRRSQRQYRSDPVEADKLNAVLDAARWAPSWSNSQSWHFVVVRDPAIRSALAGTLVSPNRAVASLNQAPVVIVACAEPGKSGVFDGKTITDKGLYWYMYDIGLAMQNISLAAHALGLATVQLGRFDAAAVAKTIGLPEKMVVVAMTPLGYPADGDNPAPPPRKALAEIVSHDRYGQL
jgi:nitroreductase